MALPHNVISCFCPLAFALHLNRQELNCAVFLGNVPCVLLEGVPEHDQPSTFDRHFDELTLLLKCGIRVLVHCGDIGKGNVIWRWNEVADVGNLLAPALDQHNLMAVRRSVGYPDRQAGDDFVIVPDELRSSRAPQAARSRPHRMYFCNAHSASWLRSSCFPAQGISPSERWEPVCLSGPAWCSRRSGQSAGYLVSQRQCHAP